MDLNDMAQVSLLIFPLPTLLPTSSTSELKQMETGITDSLPLSPDILKLLLSFCMQNYSGAAILSSVCLLIWLTESLGE